MIYQTVLSPVAVGKVGKSNNEKGLYRFGRMVASLGSSDEYLDTDLDIEYDLGVLRIQSDGEIKNLRKANKFCEFCEENKHKLGIIWHHLVPPAIGIIWWHHLVPPAISKPSYKPSRNDSN